MRTRLWLGLSWLLVLLATGAAAQAAELVMFDDPSCVYCRKWLSEVGPGYPHSEEGKLAPLRRVGIAEQRRSGVQLKLPVTATPTFVVADAAGREVGRITGYPGAEHFYPLLNEILRKLPQRQPIRAPLRETRFAPR